MRLDEVLGQAFDLAIFDGAMTSDLKLPASAPLVNQLAICAFTLKDHTGSTTVTSGLTQLTVSDGENTYVVDPIKDGYPFGEDVVYVAIKPVIAALEVTATDGAVNYSKTLTSREYARNNGYNISLRMNASVKYLVGRRHSNTVAFTETLAENPTLITNDFSGSITSGYYAVIGDNVVINGDIDLTGETRLILCDGAKLTVNLKENEQFCTRNIYIYGQESGTGQLIVTRETNSECEAIYCYSRLYIHGGNISVTSSRGTTLYVHSSFTMYGGTLIAKNTNNDNCIFSNDDITLYGGSIKASTDTDNYGAIEISGTLAVYGGQLLAKNPGGSAIKGKVKSGLEDILFYYTDTDGDWGSGIYFYQSTLSDGTHYAKAE